MSHGVRVVELAFGGLVGTHVGIARLVAEVEDVAKEMAHRILRHRPAEPGAESPVDPRRALEGPAFDVEPPEQDEAASADDLVAEREELRAEGGKRELARPDRLDRKVCGGAPRRVQLAAVRFGQPHDPVVAFAHLGPGSRQPGRRSGSGSPPTSSPRGSPSRERTRPGSPYPADRECPAGP